MSQNNFMEKLRSFLGLRSEVPRNDFRNPIWGSDDDDDDGDELYTREQMENFNDAQELHREFVQQMQDVFRNFGSLFGDMGSFFNDDFTSIGTMADVPESDIQPDNFDSNRIREYYLKPGYHKEIYGRPKEDIDLDGKISSDEVSDLLKLKDGGDTAQSVFRTQIVPRSFSKTIITTSVTKPDGTTETRRIVKSGNEIVEETITSTEPLKGPHNPSIGPINTSLIISQLSSLFHSFH